MITINIAKDYTKTPGGRLRIDGPFSGEDFRETVLKPKYEMAKKTGESLEVILDGGYGYGPSFLDEAFGGLARITKDQDLLSIIIKSDEEPSQIGNIIRYIREGLEKK